MSFAHVPYAIVGAGFWGAVMAERIASQLGQHVVVIEKRDHVGGNCHSSPDPETGIECHRYGTHIFHTVLPHVWDYITQFSQFTTYRHKVLTQYQNRVYPMPISLATINQFFERNLKPAEMEAFIKDQTRNAISGPATNLEEKAISLIGEPLYNAFIKGYTWKQWQTDPKLLPEDIITRLPVRPNYNTDYFNDPHQGMPVDGYAALFAALLNHPLIDVRLNTTFDEVASLLPPTCRVFHTGPVDAFFQYNLGRLEWRTLLFDYRTEQVADWQGTSVVNYADLDIPYTRIHEFKHLHPERPVFASPATVICTEYSRGCGPNDDPYYPVNTPRNAALLARYHEQAHSVQQNHSHFVYPVTFGGRLGQYRYFDMDRTIDSALAAFDALRSGL